MRQLSAVLVDEDEIVGLVFARGHGVVLAAREGQEHALVPGHPHAARETAVGHSTQRHETAALFEDRELAG